MSKVNLFWMRRDLRLEDNHALFNALSAGLPVRILFIFDSDILNRLEAKEDTRVTFIIKRLEELNHLLKKYASSIHIFHGKVEAVFEQLLSQWAVHTLFFNKDYEPYTRTRDQKVVALCHARGIQAISSKDHVLFEEHEILKKDHTPYTVYTPYSRQWKAAYQLLSLPSYPSELLLHRLDTSSSPLAQNLHAQIGFRASQRVAPPTELPDPELLLQYEKRRDFPAEEGTSRLGTTLRFGLISIRQLLLHAAKYSETFLGELIWREFFIQILFHFPHVENEAFKPAYSAIPWRNEIRDIERWQTGTTGFPLVDAGIRELNATGFMHNRVRMVTAGFLVKDLLVDWRVGELWFAQHLMDYELASNNGNWQWAAGTGCDAAPYFRIFNPTSQQKQFDPERTYIKRWIPEYGTPSYAKEMINHKEARTRAIAHYKRYRKG